MNDDPKPSTLGPNGQDAKGRFTKGNKLGIGNPLAGRAAKIRAILLESLTDKDAREIAKTLVAPARSGDLAAIRELLDRTIGKPSQADVNERIEKLESLLEGIRLQGRN